MFSMMIRIPQETVRLPIQSMVEEIIAAGRMSRQQHLQLTSMMLADQRMSDEDRRQINRVLDYIQTGRVRLIR